MISGGLKHLGIAMAATTLGGCSTAYEKTLYYANNDPDLATSDVSELASDSEALVASFVSIAGLPKKPEAGEEWRPVIDAGMHYADVRCERFLDALFWINRVKQSASNQVQYTSAATSAILSLVNASKNLLGIAPLGFGFLNDSIDNFGSTLLYGLEPGAVTGLVHRSQGEFRNGLKKTGYTNQAVALRTVYAYSSLCLPVTIERQVGEAVKNAKFSLVEPKPKSTDTAKDEKDTVDESGDSSPGDNNVQNEAGEEDNYIPQVEQEPA